MHDAPMTHAVFPCLAAVCVNRLEARAQAAVARATQLGQGASGSLMCGAPACEFSPSSTPSQPRACGVRAACFAPADGGSGLSPPVAGRALAARARRGWRVRQTRWAGGFDGMLEERPPVAREASMALASRARHCVFVLLGRVRYGLTYFSRAAAEPAVRVHTSREEGTLIHRAEQRQRATKRAGAI